MLLNPRTRAARFVAAFRSIERLCMLPSCVMLSLINTPDLGEAELKEPFTRKLTAMPTSPLICTRLNGEYKQQQVSVSLTQSIIMASLICHENGIRESIV